MSSLYNCIWRNKKKHLNCFFFVFIVITFLRVEKHISWGKDSLLVDSDLNLLYTKRNIAEQGMSCSELQILQDFKSSFCSSIFFPKFSFRSLVCSLSLAISVSVCSSCFNNSDGSSDSWISTISLISEELLDAGVGSLKETLRSLSSSLFGLEIRPNLVFTTRRFSCSKCWWIALAGQSSPGNCHFCLQFQYSTEKPVKQKLSILKKCPFSCLDTSFFARIRHLWIQYIL